MTALGQPAPATTATATTATATATTAPPTSRGRTWVMFGISVVALLAACIVAIALVKSIPMIGKLPEGIGTPMEYVLNEAGIRFAVPVAIFGLIGAMLALVSILVTGLNSKLWLEFSIKLSALCAILYTSALVLSGAWLL